MALQGHMDTFQEGAVFGWAKAEGQPVAFVDIYLDGALVGTARADQFRKDLVAAGVGDGHHGFLLPINEGMFTAGEHLLSARFSGTEVELSGSPLRIVTQASGSKHQAVLGDVLRNPTFSQMSSSGGIAKAGRNQVAPGIWIEFSNSSIGHTSYSAGQFEGLEFSRLGSLVSGLRIRAPLSNSHTRLTFELGLPNFVLLDALSAAVVIGKKQANPDFKLKLVLGVLKDGKIASVWSKTVDRMVDGTVEWTAPIPPNVINELRTKVLEAGGLGVAAFEFLGRVDLTISAPHLLVGRQIDMNVRDGDFEDLVVANQWEKLLPNKSSVLHSGDEGAWHFQGRINVPEIIVPVFNASRLVLECIESVRNNTDMPHLLTIVDDGSFEALLENLSRQIDARPWARLLKAHKNEGYTVAVNRAVKSSAGNVVVILNSDTHVTPGWLQGLLECLESSPDTGMAGPLSNAASWQSVPKVKDEHGWAVNQLPLGSNPVDQARLVRAESMRLFPTVPILNGFCTAIKVEVFDRCGLFDELTFPSGYGEENDFCMRASDAGFKLRVADHVYVYHHKSASFGHERRNELAKKAGAVLTQRYGEARMKSLDETLSESPELKRIREAFASKLLDGEVA